MRKLNTAIVGASGAVGQEFLGLLEKRNWNVDQLHLLASSRSAGKTVQWKGKTITIQNIETFDPSGVDVALFSAGSGPSKTYAREYAKKGALVVDNSSAFRMDPEIPLIVPEVNLDAVSPNHNIIANPNCCTIILLMAVAPLRQFGRIRKLIVSTYQSASGAGAAAMEELLEQTSCLIQGKPAQKNIFPHQIAFNLFSHNTAIEENLYNGEENKIIAETRKILADDELSVIPTCIRVPILRAHSESVHVEFVEKAPTIEQVIDAYERTEGVKVVNDVTGNTFPMPLDASGIDDVLVGRIRKDLGDDRCLNLFVAGDQLLKGAALNAVQIAERVIADRNLGHD